MKIFLLLTSVLLTSCSQIFPAPTATSVPPTETALQTPSPTISPDPTATRIAPPASQSPLSTPSNPNALTITASDGAQLAAMYYPPIVTPAPAVLLLHQNGGSKADWDSFAKQLQKMGYAALALDLRGHGASPRPVDWAKGPDDARSAYNVMIKRPEVDSLRTAIVDASVGSNLALMVGASEPKVSAVIAISPGLDYLGVNPSSSMRNFANRPALLVASQDDPYSFTSVKSLAQLAIAAEPKLLTNAGHGTEILTRDPTLSPSLMEWLNKYVRDLKS